MGDSARYQLKDTLGRGGMGVIFRAYDTLMRRDVALKTVLDAQDKSARELFYREWGVQASITHPNIAEIYDIGEMVFEGQPRPYFVMPLLRGAPLADLLRSSRHSLTPERAVSILRQACRGLQAAHDRQLIHRDLKPSNIFVLEDDSVKLIDFGIAHLGDVTHTSIRGTLAYMAPELLDGKPANKASDIFALGVVSYETLTGRRPFFGADDAAVAHAIRTATPPLPSEIDPRVGGDLSRVIFRALAKQPWQRYGDVREFADFLDRAVRGDTIELFDPAKVKPRLDKALRSVERGDYALATDIVGELEGEGNVDAEIISLRRQIDQAQRGVQIRKYLENARRLLEEQEYSLALRKVQEALELDERNSDALALKNEIEKQRRARTAEDWFALARRHIDNGAYAQARSVLNNLLEVKPDEDAVQELRAELERREAESARLRSEKERLQREARGAWERGEVTAAMSNLERWMDLDRSTPETDASRIASVRNLFVTVRTEHEAIRNSYEQARALLQAGKFDEASDLCKLYLSKYPSHALFQAVQFDVDERRRQALSAFIAEVDQRASNEADLDRRVAILEDAASRYPAESHFQRALEPARAKRDLVNSIVARARLFEEQGKLVEALEQWELLGPVHAAYPGLEYEKDRVRKRREAQSRNEAKATWVEQVESHLAHGDYERAFAAATGAAAEFPDDPEIGEIGRTAHSRLEGGRRAAALIAEARALLATGASEEAAERLRTALLEDERNPVVRPLLVRTLAERAQASIDAGGSEGEAEKLLAEAAGYDPRNAQVANLKTVLADRQRERAVSEAMAEARRMFNERNLAGALDACRRALQRFPSEVRLAQLAANLEAALNREQAPAAAQQATPPPQPPPLQPTPPSTPPPAEVSPPAKAQAAPARPTPPPSPGSGPQARRTPTGLPAAAA
ncbi:MAG: protein kinase, partial [Acidobacteria bacterium]|nr:protein kinase [Acidobacteriota bacterium]